LTVKVYLIRHGETEYNRDGKLQGDSDVPLSDRGKTQAEVLAARLKDEFSRNGEKVSAIYSSNLRRTLDTARAIGERLGLVPQPVRELREIDLGSWEGKTPDEISAEKDIAFFEEWKKDPARMRAPGGENLEDVESRVIPKFDELKKNHEKSDAIIIVSHGGSIGVILSHILRMDLNDALKIRQDNTALNLIEVRGDGEYILVQNDTSHLKS
jgi:broad specificity phosphatase PhoE